MGLTRAVGLPRATRARTSTLDPDAELLARIRVGEERAFVELVSRYQASLMRLARNYVASDAVAEEVIQDTWLAVLRGLDGFAERSTFRTWLLKILVNRAMSTGVREHRSVAIGDGAPAVEVSRSTPRERGCQRQSIGSRTAMTGSPRLR